MLKTIRGFLYGLAILAGVTGLIDGGIPLVKYAMELWRDPEYSSYYNTNELNAPKIILLLSLIFLACVRISLSLDRKISPAIPADPIKKGDVCATAKEIIPNLASPETIAPPAETPDERLTRLLSQKKD